MLPGEKRRVAIYRTDVLPFSETFIAQQMRAMRRYDPTLIGKYRLAGLEMSDLPVITAHGSRPSGWRGREPFPLPAPRPLFEPAREAGFDLIHAHFGPDGFSALPLARRLDLPWVVTIHGYDAARSTSLSEGPHRWAYGKLLPIVLARATCVIAVSDHVRRLLLARGCRPGSVVTHYIGIDTDRFDEVPLESRTTDDLVVLAVGRFVEKKGFGHLIEAFKTVAANEPRARLVIVGDGELRGDLIALAESHPRVEFRGRASSDEVLAEMRRAAVLAVPSVTAADGDTEGLPIVLLEGMATGTPIVATRHAGIPEAVEDGRSGWLVDERKIEPLAGAIAEALTQRDEAARRGAAAARRARSQFDLRTQTARLEDIYDAVRLHRLRT